MISAREVCLQAFTYGTLLSEKVLIVLLGTVPPRTEAVLSGYSRHPITGRCYPAVIRSSPSSSVRGKLLTLSAEQLCILDNFEDPAYDRRVVQVETPNGEKVNARIWARPDHNRQDLIETCDWNYERFFAEDHDWYLQICTEWRANFRKSLTP